MNTLSFSDHLAFGLYLLLLVTIVGIHYFHKKTFSDNNALRVMKGTYRTIVYVLTLIFITVFFLVGNFTLDLDSVPGLAIFGTVSLLVVSFAIEGRTVSKINKSGLEFDEITSDELIDKMETIDSQRLKYINNIQLSDWPSFKAEFNKFNRHFGKKNHMKVVLDAEMRQSIQENYAGAGEDIALLLLEDNLQCLVERAEVYMSPKKVKSGAGKILEKAQWYDSKQQLYFFLLSVGDSHVLFMAPDVTKGEGEMEREFIRSLLLQLKHLTGGNHQ